MESAPSNYLKSTFGWNSSNLVQTSVIERSIYSDSNVESYINAVVTLIIFTGTNITRLHDGSKLIGLSTSEQYFTLIRQKVIVFYMSHNFLYECQPLLGTSL